MFLDLTIKRIVHYCVVASSIVLMLGFVINALTGQKLHYVIFIAISLLVTLLIRPTYFLGYKLLYLIPLAASIVVGFLHGAADLAFIISILPYFVIPFIFFGEAFRDFELDGIMKVFGFFTVFYLLGVCLQMAGVTSPYLMLDRAMTEGEVHDRYGSFAGSSLGLGFTGSISAIYYYYLYTYKSQKTFFTLSMVILSILTLLLAQSRRFYILVFVVMFITYLANKNKNLSGVKILRFSALLLLGLIAVLYILYLFKDSSLLLQRIFSTFDFENDGSNVMRVTKWLFAIESFLNNFWFGMGVGATGTIGKNFDSTDAAADIFSAESYFIKVFVEGGVIFGLAFLVIMFAYLKRAFASLKSSDNALAGLVFLFFFIECFVSTALEAPLGTLLFWICISRLTKKEKLASKSISISSSPIPVPV